MKKWIEKEFSQWVYYDEEDGKIIGYVYKVGNQLGIWGARAQNNHEETVLGQYIDSDYAKKAIERYWNVMSRTLLENK